MGRAKFYPELMDKLSGASHPDDIKIACEEIAKSLVNFTPNQMLAFAADLEATQSGFMTMYILGMLYSIMNDVNS